MKRFILPLAAGFVLGVSGAAMAGSLKADDSTVTTKATSPQLLTNSQMDEVVAGVTTGAKWDNYIDAPGNGTTIYCVPSDTGQIHGFGGDNRAGNSGAYTNSATCPN